MTDNLPQVYALNTGFGFFMYQIFERFVYGWPVPILSAIMVSILKKQDLKKILYILPMNISFCLKQEYYPYHPLDNNISHPDPNPLTCNPINCTVFAGDSRNVGIQHVSA